MIYNTIKQISLIIGGTLLGLVFTTLESTLQNSEFTYSLLSVFLILIGIGLIDWIINLLSLVIRKNNDYFKIVGVYQPIYPDSDISSWIDVSNRKILNTLKKNNLNYKIVTNEADFKKFPLIINPYGGSYIEYRIESFSSLENIFSSVKF